MIKRKGGKYQSSFLNSLFSRRLLMLYCLVILPILFWATQQRQQLISFGTSSVIPQQTEFSCPLVSSQSYNSLRVVSDSPRTGSADQNPEINLALRGYEEVDEKTELINLGGDTDPIMPPNIGSMFSQIPSMVKTYKVHKWDWGNNRRSPDLESNWPVNLIGLSTKHGDPLIGPKAGREIGDGNVLMLIFATNSSVTFVHGIGDNVGDGYFIHIDNFCVDPNLLSGYEKNNSEGRISLPVIRTGQIFGYGNGSDIRIAIRDSGDWMDPRSKKDWWQGIDSLPAAVKTPVPTNNPAPSLYPQLPTDMPSVTNYIHPTEFSVTPIVFATITQITSTPILYLSPIPPTPTITSSPLIERYVTSSRTAWDKMISYLRKLALTILP